jgi:hypothetical protein
MSGRATAIQLAKRLAVIAFVFVATIVAVKDAHAERPNVVLILADDVSAGMFSCYGQRGSANTA